MPLDNRYQKKLCLDTMPSAHRLPETDREKIKAWLGELIVSVFEAKPQALGRKEVSHE
jgi:hypothetical protein